MAHFTIGFLLGWALWWLAVRRRSGLAWRLYGPYLPFALGALAALPHAARLLGWAPEAGAMHPAWNLFVLFPLIEASAGLTRLLGSFELDVALVALAYAHMTLHYIGLVRSARAGHAQ